MNADIVALLLAGIDCANEILSNHKQGKITIIDDTRLSSFKHLIDEQLRGVKKITL